VRHIIPRVTPRTHDDEVLAVLEQLAAAQASALGRKMTNPAPLPAVGSCGVTSLTSLRNPPCGGIWSEVVERYASVPQRLVASAPLADELAVERP
jgi:hypothetical protein